MKTSTALATDIDLAATLARHEVLLQQILLAVQALQSSRALSRSDRERLAKILPVLGASSATNCSQVAKSPTRERRGCDWSARECRSSSSANCFDVPKGNQLAG